MEISVIIPVYNIQSYINQCIDSVLRQTFKDFELILIDDGSTDQSGIICDWYAEKDERISVYHQENQGLSVARNRGVESARGRFVTFIDSDDYIANNYLQLLYEAAISTGSQIAVCQHYHFQNSVVEEPRKISDPIIMSGREAVLQVYKPNSIVFITAWAKLFDTKIIREIPFPVGKIHEDEAVIPKVLYLAKRVCVIEDKLYYYRIRNDSIMAQKFSVRRYDGLEAIDGCIALFQDYGEDKIANQVIEYRQELIARYSILARKTGIYKEVPKKYKMRRLKAWTFLMDHLSHNRFTYFLSQTYPRWLKPYLYFNKARKVCIVFIGRFFKHCEQ